ncbi:glycosyltransferase family 2 protein [Rhodococcus sp. NPDC003383]
MATADTLVSVGLPVRNGADRIQNVVESVLGQDHENLELVIGDNASTDGTEELCRDLAAQDKRIVYHRNPVNTGLLNNFVGVMRLSRGTFFRWVGDDDWLAPTNVSRSLEAFAADERSILVTTQLEYAASDGSVQTAEFRGDSLASEDPVTRFAEMLRLLNESHLLIDPLYGLFRRAVVAEIDRRNMMREDEVFATKLALAGPWGHVPEVLGRRHWEAESVSALVRKLDLPPWHAWFVTTLQCREILHWLVGCDLSPAERRRAQLEVARMYARRQKIIVARRGRRLARMAGIRVRATAY